jgi:putative hydrolase of the HAD superfamily
MIKAVLFDLDGTLFDRDAAVESIARWQAQTFIAAIGAERNEHFRDRLIAMDAHGYRDKREVYAELGVEFGLSQPIVEQLIASFWSEYPRHCRLGDGVADTLAELRRRSLRTGIVTNGSAAVQSAAIDALGIRDAVDVVLISETERIRKPHPEIFHRAAAQLNVDPKECCFVGDHPVMDVAGAEAAGYRAIWKRTPYWVPLSPCTTVDSIPEILDIIQ